jgi:hypothetical protein
METNESYQVFAGTRLVIPATVRDATGAVVTTYAGTEALTTSVWPGGTRTESFAPATAWASHAEGTITITIASVDTAKFAPGRYQLLTTVNDDGESVAVYGCTLDILSVAGDSAEPKSYGGYDDMLRYGRAWLRQLQTDDDEAGFAEQRARARSWVEDLAHAHYPVASLVMVVGGRGMSPRRSGARSTWLQDQLDADTLMVTDRVREAVAKKALAFVCEGQVGTNASATAYARLARMYHSQADYLGTCLTLQLDTDGDGEPDVAIHCSSTDPMYG